MSQLANRRAALQDNDIVRAVTGEVPTLRTEPDDVGGEFSDPIFETIPTGEFRRTGGPLSWALIGAAALAAGLALLLVLVTGLGCSGVVELDPGGSFGDDDDVSGDDDTTMPDDDAADDDAADDDTDDGDADGDGYTVEDGDCDDTDDSVYPGAEEICDEVDHDCDGLAVPDADGDGIDLCDDCDDADETVHPGAEEICDGLDNDCDGDLPAVEADDDGDGYRRCDLDCDDTDPSVNPGASEVPYDSVDNDCDGGDLTDVDGDGYDGDAMPDGADCDDTDASIHPGATEVNGDNVDSDCDGNDDVMLGETCLEDSNTISVPGFVSYTLSWDDEYDGMVGYGYVYDDIEFYGAANTQIGIGMWDSELGLDPYLYLLDPTCQVVAEDDNGADAYDDDAYIEYDITSSGVYTIVATSADPWQTGDYEVEVW